MDAGSTPAASTILHFGRRAAALKKRSPKQLAIATAFATLFLGIFFFGYYSPSGQSDVSFAFNPSPREWQIGTGYLNFGPPNLRPRYTQIGPFVFYRGMAAVAEEFMKPKPSLVSTNAPQVDDTPKVAE
jgi:hypothetical protein